MKVTVDSSLAKSGWATAINESGRATAINKSGRATAINNNDVATAIKKSSRAMAINNGDVATAINKSGKATATTKADEPTGPCTCFSDGGLWPPNLDRIPVPACCPATATPAALPAPPQRRLILSHEEPQLRHLRRR